VAFEVRPRWKDELQAIVEVPGCGTFPDEASARAWAIATHTTVTSGGFLPLKLKARAVDGRHRRLTRRCSVARCR
jgi:hypothetical protein